MTLFSFRTLAVAWTGVAGAAAVSAAALQASYVPPAPPVVVAAAIPPVPVLPAPRAPAALAQAALPFENRSLLAMLPPPEIHPRPQLRIAESRAARLPLPPVPPLRTVRLEPHRAPARGYAPEPVYAAEPAYPAWAWRNRLPYPGQYAMGRAYYGGQSGYYGWQPMY